MRVVIVGSYSLSEMAVDPLVTKLIMAISEKYSKLIIVAMDCDRGVGKLIKNMCLPGDKSKPKFCLEELALRIYLAGPELTSAERAALMKARNAYLVEVGEEFHIMLGEEGMHGMMGDLCNRLRDQQAMVAVYKPGEVEVREAAQLQD